MLDPDHLLTELSFLSSVVHAKWSDAVMHFGFVNLSHLLQ